MSKKVLAAVLAIAMIAAMWMLPTSAVDADVVMDLQYADVNWKGQSEVPVETLPIVHDYAGNLTMELYIKINDFQTPTVIAGAWGGIAGYAVWVNGGTLYFTSGGAAGNSHVTMGADKTAAWVGKWIHIVGVKNGAQNSIYVSPEGSDTYESSTAARNGDRVYADGYDFVINGANTPFAGAGDFALGTIRMYNQDKSADRAAMKAECEARLAGGPEEPPIVEETEMLYIQVKPTRLTYTVGDELNTEGFRAAIRSAEGEVTVVDNDACLYAYDFGAAGKVKVAVFYTDDAGTAYANSFTVTVNEVPAVRQIILASKPSKLYYNVGESLVTEGLTVLAKYTDGSTKTIQAADLTVSGYNPTQAGVQKLTVAFEDFAQTTAFSVKVKAVEKKFSDAMILDADFSDSDPTDGVGGRVPAVTNVTYVNDTEINRTVAAFNISNMKYPLADPDDYVSMVSKCTLEAYVNVGGANGGTWGVIAGPFSFRSQGGMALCTGSLAGFGSGPMSVTAGKNKNIVGGATGVWQHVVWTFDNGATALYVDGQQVATGNYGANVISFDTTTGLMIGAHDDGSNFAIVNSKIAFVRLYSDCATAEQVTELYNAR